MSDKPKRIHGRKFLLALHEAGILGEHEYVRRVVIDASVDGAVVMYVERYGDERLLTVATTLDGVEIRREDDPVPLDDGEVRLAEPESP